MLIFQTETILVSLSPETYGEKMVKGPCSSPLRVPGRASFVEPGTAYTVSPQAQPRDRLQALSGMPG